ncbi:MAG: TatD family hydrolase [Lettuce witches'-broom phytoplasma]
MLIDTHAHLNLDDYSKDLKEVINRAVKNNVQYFIVPGLDQKTNEKAIELALQNPEIKVAVGIHPSYVTNADPFSIEKYLKLPQVVAVGEIGIDLYHEQKTLPLQQKTLQIQVELAIKYDLPIILHARSSFEEIYEILLPYKNKIRGVFHSLVTDLETAQRAIDLGFYVGIGGIVTYEKALEVHTLAKQLPLDKILLETDSPFLMPSPGKKSHRNEPALVKLVAEKIASLRNITLEEVAEQTTQNVKKLFLPHL